jgi:tRNA (pseudouridine54-N1)-methyltransferase
MREFIYYSRTAPTAGNYIRENLQESGRIDIAIHTVISTFFLSHAIRTDAKLHMIFAGPPTPPRHIEMSPVVEGKTGIDKIYLAKSNVSAVIKRLLYKYREGVRTEVFPGFWIEKKGFLELANELAKQGRSLYMLDPKGEDLRTVEIGKDPIFILGDHKGVPAKELKRLKKNFVPVSIGPRTYFASQTIAIVNNELDRREAEGRL